MPANLQTPLKLARAAGDEPVTVPRLPEADGPDQAPDVSVSWQTAGSLAGVSAPPSAVRATTGVLRREESARARGFGRAVTLLSIIGLALQPLLGGTGWLHVLAVVALVALAVASGFIWRIAREPIRYTPVVVRAYGATSAVSALIVVYYLGVFSPAPMLVMLGVGFFALADDKRVALAVPVAMSVGYFLLAILIVCGVLPDAGMLRALDAPTSVRLPMTGMVPLVFLFGVWQARLSRHAMLDALQRSNEALRVRLQREAQLEEANRDIDHMLRVGVKRAGPYSGVNCGSYVLGDLIGRGAMGEVYAAKHTETGRVAAVKLLQSSMLTDAHLVLRFLREGEAVSKLRGPNVVTILDVGKTDEGAPFIVMELLRGHDLAWHLQQRTYLSLEEVEEIVDQIGLGLEAARVAGIVHRDLKPQNLFLAQQPGAAPLWKILDFGVSRLINSGGTLTQEGIVGTPGYMSPEQASGLEATHRSDVFSFGVVVYRALTGEPPFSGPDTPQILYQVVYRCPLRPSELVPSLPPDVDLVLALALAKDPEDRFASALDLAAAMRAAAKGELDASLRLHAQTLLAALPWGRSAREGIDGSNG